MGLSNFSDASWATEVFASTLPIPAEYVCLQWCVACYWVIDVSWGWGVPDPLWGHRRHFLPHDSPELEVFAWAPREDVCPSLHPDTSGCAWCERRVRKRVQKRVKFQVYASPLWIFRISLTAPDFSLASLEKSTQFTVNFLCVWAPKGSSCQDYPPMTCKNSLKF